MKPVLLVDDEAKLRKILHSSLSKMGYPVFTAANGKEARELVRDKTADIVLLDMMLPDTTGLELLHELVPLYPQKAFIVMTAYGNVESAVLSMKSGAFDYITKPAKLEEIVIALERASEWIDMKQENVRLKQKLSLSDRSRELIGASPAMQRIFQLAERVAGTDATVLLEGESGTGKSRIARMIHDMSERPQAPFVAVNCAAIPEQLLESELFGYEKGAFTGAAAARSGKFEAAHGGTIFLDEIGEISAALQAKLLQVTQEKSFMRLGSNKLKHVDVRIISATNRDLRSMVNKGSFREDLYYRLNIVDMYLPPVRERAEDIPMLVEQFLERHRIKHGKQYHISSPLLRLLMDYHWPGNVREIENAVERAVVLCRDNKLSIEDFPREIRELRRESRETASPGTASPNDAAGIAASLPDQLDEIERNLIEQALEGCQGHVAAAARKLGVSRQSLLYKINKYNMKV